jgi:glycosyltransferase involved in cell wall biosynthesis
MPGSAESAGIGVADEREPGAHAPHGGRLVRRGTGPAAARTAGGQRAQPDVLAGRRPHAAARDAARRVGLFFTHGPSARACAARIGLDDGRLRDWRSSVEGLSTAALPGFPSPRLTFAGRLRGNKAPDVLIEALALIDAPPPAYLVGDGPAVRPADPADPGSRAGSGRLTGHRYWTCPARPCRSLRRR